MDKLAKWQSFVYSVCTRDIFIINLSHLCSLLIAWVNIKDTCSSFHLSIFSVQFVRSLYIRDAYYSCLHASISSISLTSPYAHAYKLVEGIVTKHLFTTKKPRIYLTHRNCLNWNKTFEKCSNRFITQSFCVYYELDTYWSTMLS